MTARLTDAEIKALEDASWTGGRTAWLAAIEGIIAERLAAGAALLLAGVALKRAERRHEEFVDDSHVPLHQEDK